MRGIGRDNGQVDLLVPDVVPIEHRSVAQHILQFALDGWEERFVCQRLTPELDDELEFHLGLAPLHSSCFALHLRTWQLLGNLLRPGYFHTAPARVTGIRDPLSYPPTSLSPRVR